MNYIYHYMHVPIYWVICMRVIPFKSTNYQTTLLYVPLPKKLKIECVLYTDLRHKNIYINVSKKKNQPWMWFIYWTVEQKSELFASVLAQIKFSNITSIFILNDYIETITQLPNFTIHTIWYTSPNVVVVDNKNFGYVSCSILVLEWRWSNSCIENNQHYSSNNSKKSSG
jgi:hypothetical protein